MASARSWLASSRSNKNRPLSSSSHELPLWRTPSPMSASIIPPPIVQSTYASPPPRPTIEQSPIMEKPSVFEERQHDLEADLQFLLDAQAEGLVRGIEGGSLDDRSSTGSTTPTAQSVRSLSSRRQRKPMRRQPGLKSARKGIYNSIIALSSLKDDELDDVNDELDGHKGKLERIETWERKRQGLREAVGNVGSSEDTVRVQRLKQEAEALQAEINNVELQLSEMKSRQRKLLRQATAVENAVQAKLASYTSSLQMLEDDVQKFLSIKPPGETGQTVPEDGEKSVWQLPPKRRNLNMAKDYWSEQRELLLGQKRQHEYEKSALVEGAALWKETVIEITGFEKQLREEMSTLRPSSPNSLSGWEEQPSPGAASDRLKELTKYIDIVIVSMQRKHQIAEEKSWSLLIAAIGAELDALQRGKAVLADVLSKSSGQLIDDTNEHDGTKTDSSNEIHALDKSFETARPLVANVSDAAEEDHDEPDPELLFSRQDTDTE